MESEILERIPQRHPFLYIDKILDRTENSITTHKFFSKDESFFQGHFPGDPVVPGVILCEAAFQTGALLMSYQGGLPVGTRAVVTRIQNAKFKNLVTSEEEIQVKVELDQLVGNAGYFKGTIIRDTTKILTIEFSCMLVEQ